MLRWIYHNFQLIYCLAKVIDSEISVGYSEHAQPENDQSQFSDTKNNSNNIHYQQTQMGKQQSHMYSLAIDKIIFISWKNLDKCRSVATEISVNKDKSSVCIGNETLSPAFAHFDLLWCNTNKWKMKWNETEIN